MILKETVTTAEGTSEILIEVAAQHVPRVRAGGGSAETDVPTRAFTKGMELIRTCAEQVSKSIQGIVAAARPQEAEVEFGIKLDAEAGAFIAKSPREPPARRSPNPAARRGGARGRRAAVPR